MNQGTPTVAGRKLSSSLKERLKRCGRYHSSPVSTPLARRIPDSNKESILTSPLALSVPLKEDDTELKMVKSSSLENENPNRGQESSVSKSLPWKAPWKKTEGQGQMLLPASVCVSRTLSDSSFQELKCDGSELVKNPSRNISKPFTKHTPVTSRSRSVPNVKIGRLNFDDGKEENDKKDDIVFLSSAINHDLKPESGGMSKDYLTQYKNCSFGDVRSVCAENLSEVKRKLQQELSEKEETLRKLRMVKMYREKNDLSELQCLINKWHSTSQQALLDLHELLPEPKPTLTELVDHLRIDHTFINYNVDEETFN